MKEWQDLTRMVGDESILIERVRIADKEMVIEGCFDLPPLAKLAMEDQVFVAAFVKSHGSIKQMERLFGVSYPTIKNRLNRISERLSFIDIRPVKDDTDVLEQLNQGEITVEEALRRLEE